MSIYIAKCDVGWGVFAARRFVEGERILAFGGPIIDFVAALRKGVFEANAIQIGHDCYIDLDPPGVYVNHACDPNAGVRDGNLLVAIRAIEAGEEIRFDYSTTMAEDHWEMDCLCRAATCRRRVRDFRHLPEALRRRYQRIGIAPQFVVRTTDGSKK